MLTAHGPWPMDEQNTQHTHSILSVLLVHGPWARDVDDDGAVKCLIIAATRSGTAELASPTAARRRRA